MGETAKMPSHATNRSLLLQDVGAILDEHLGQIEEALTETHCEKPAKIAVTIAWKPATKDAPFRVEVDGKATLPAVGAVRDVSMAGGQMQLFGGE